MKRILQITLCLVFMGISITSNAQLINFEETWKAFLENNKTSNISKLPQPPTNSIDFPKYCLMYANSNFCFNRVDHAQKFMRKIEEFGEDKYKTIPGFVERYEDLGTKIKAYHQLAKIWDAYLEDHQISLEKLEEVSTARQVCEKGTLAKYTQMETYAYYCMGDVEKAKDIFENYVLQIVDKTTLKISDVNGLENEVAVFRQLFKVLPVLNPAWAEFVKTDVSKGFDMEVPVLECNSVPAIKAYLLQAAADICNQGMPMLKKIKELEAKNKGNIDDEVAAKIKWLEETAAYYNGDDVALNKAWNEFTPNNTLAKELDWTLIYCDKVAQIRSYTMNGILHICNKGGEMLKTIEEYQAKHNVTLDATTQKKIDYLEEQFKTFNGDLATLNAAWKEFTPNNTLAKELDWTLIYCDKVAQIRSYTMNGVLHHCTLGEEMLSKIASIQKDSKVDLDATTEKKVDALKAMVQKTKDDFKLLSSTWKTFIAENDTLTQTVDLAKVYCDKIAQVRYWTIEGHLNYCNPQGDEYVEKIDGLTKEHSLEFDKELACSIQRLRNKIWNCKYWQLVLQARKETHEERERFGPQAAELMYEDLNGPKQPCETKVEYSAVGYIGVKYVITTYLCQNINLAKMGDPEYYKKIATWVDTKVLQKYCAADMRCKEDFFIYLEGHSDGNRFSGARYSNSLDIPQGTPFTHFDPTGTIHNKNTDREITNSLKNNMELGIARAWTVKQQLDFMNVPISIGAYEHPESEKGGEFRRIEIELNIPNLLLDFYEMRLKTLWEESGIGERPDTCQY